MAVKKGRKEKWYRLLRRSLQIIAGSNNKDRITGGQFGRVPVIGGAGPITDRKGAKVGEMATFQDIIKDQPQTFKIMKFQPKPRYFRRKPAVRKTDQDQSSRDQYSADFVNYLPWIDKVFNGEAANYRIIGIIAEWQEHCPVEVMNNMSA